MTKMIDPFDNINLWKIGTDKDARLKTSKVIGKMGNGIQLDYDFGKRDWVQIERDFTEKLNENDIVRIAYKTSEPGNPLEIKIQDKDGTVFGGIFKIEKTTNDYRILKIKLSELKHYWGGDNNLDLENLQKISE